MRTLKSDKDQWFNSLLVQDNPILQFIFPLDVCLKAVIHERDRLAKAISFCQKHPDMDLVLQRDLYQDSQKNVWKPECLIEANASSSDKHIFFRLMKRERSKQCSQYVPTETHLVGPASIVAGVVRSMSPLGDLRHSRACADEAWAWEPGSKQVISTLKAYQAAHDEMVKRVHFYEVLNNKPCIESWMQSYVKRIYSRTRPNCRKIDFEDLMKHLHLQIDLRLIEYSYLSAALTKALDMLANYRRKPEEYKYE